MSSCFPVERREFDLRALSELGKYAFLLLCLQFHHRLVLWELSFPINLPDKVGIKLGILYSIGIWKTQQWPQDWKRSFFIPILRKGNAKECSDYYTIVLISQLAK